jgi:uncharacterized membrane protein
MLCFWANLFSHLNRQSFMVPDICQLNMQFFKNIGGIYSWQQVEIDNRHTRACSSRKKKMNAIANSRLKTPMVSWFVWSPALFCFENVCAQKMAIKTKLTVDTHQTDSVKYPLFLLSQNHLFDYSIMWNCLANKTIRYFLRSNHKSFQLAWRIKASLGEWKHLKAEVWTDSIAQVMWWLES